MILSSVLGPYYKKHTRLTVLLGKCNLDSNRSLFVPSSQESLSGNKSLCVCVLDHECKEEVWD